MNIIIPKDTPIKFSWSQFPIESPTGILENNVMNVEFNDHHYQVLEYFNNSTVSAIDIETGDIVTLDFKNHQQKIFKGTNNG